jgi:hypothetical protein
VELPATPERSDRSAIAEIARANLSTASTGMKNGTRIVFLTGAIDLERRASYHTLYIPQDI